LQHGRSLRGAGGGQAEQQERASDHTALRSPVRKLPARSRIVEPAQEAKVFWFFSSEKNTLASRLQEEAHVPRLRGS
jgi:hypothetical protein